MKRAFILAVSSWMAAVLLTLLLAVSYVWTQKAKHYRSQSLSINEYIEAKQIAWTFIDELLLHESKEAYIQTYLSKFNDSNKDTENGEIGMSLTEGSMVLNINTVNYGLLYQLMLSLDIPEANKKAAAILAWRGDKESKLVPKEAFNYFAKAYRCKKAPFDSIHELDLVKEINTLSLDKIRKLKELLTVYGNGRININYIDQDTLALFFEYLRLNLSLNINSKNAAQTFVRYREDENIIFKDYDEVEALFKAIFAKTWDSRLKTEFRLLSSNFEFKSEDLLINVFKQEPVKHKSLLKLYYNYRSKKLVYLWSSI